MYYHAEFGSSALKGVDINTGEPQNWGALGLSPFRLNTIDERDRQTDRNRPPAKTALIRTAYSAVKQETQLSMLCRHADRVIFVGGSRGTSPSLDLIFPPTGLSENLGGMERGRGGKGESKGWGRPPALLPRTGFCLKYHPACSPFYEGNSSGAELYCRSRHSALQT